MKMLVVRLSIALIAALAAIGFVTTIKGQAGGSAETIVIDTAAPARPFPHIWEQMFGSGVSYRFSTHQVDTTMLGIVRLNNWGKIRNLIMGKVRIVYPRCAEVNGDGTM